jgi:hypothetical protein
MNKNNKEFHVMKIAYNKLDEENRKNSKLMQEIIMIMKRVKGTVRLMTIIILMC